MSKNIILDRLNNLKYLHPLKNSNITIMSKKNTYGDIVKFYAQINTEEVVQKISYKATGCSYFIAFCDYYCELVEGKNLKKIQKISKEDLENFCNLDDSRVHVAEIIFSTFSLLVKKYKKGVEKGIITPCEISEQNEVILVEKKTIKANKKVDTEIALTKKYAKKNIKLRNILVQDDQLNDNINLSKENDSSTKSQIIAKNSKKKHVKQEKVVKVQEIKIEEEKIVEEEKAIKTIDALLNDKYQVNNNVEVQEEMEKADTQEQKKIKKNTKIDKSVKQQEKPQSKFKESNNKIDSKKQNSHITKEESKTEVKHSETKKNIHTNNLADMSSRLKKETNKDSVANIGNVVEKESVQQNKVANLSMMINKMNSSSSQLDDGKVGSITVTTEVKKRTHILSIKNSLSSIHARQENSRHIEEEHEIKEVIVEPIEENDDVDKEKCVEIEENVIVENSPNEDNQQNKKKGLFSWFRKK